MSHGKGGDARGKKVKEREKSTDRGEAAVMDTGEGENETEGVTLIIAFSAAVTSFIFTHYKVFCFYWHFFVVVVVESLQQRTERPSKVWFVCLINESTRHKL